MAEDVLSESFAERLNQALDIRNYPPLRRGRISYIQEIFDVSRAGANKWLYGGAIPHPRKRDEIARKLGVNLNWLETGKGSMFDRNDTNYSADKQVHKIPLLTMRQAYIMEDISDFAQTEFLIVSYDIPQHCIAIRNVGSAMEPRFHDGNILIMNPNVAIQDGDSVIVKTSLLPEVLFRQYIKGSESEYLIALNSKFEMICIDENVHILGKIIETRHFL